MIILIFFLLNLLGCGVGPAAFGAHHALGATFGEEEGPWESELPALLRRDHTSYPALQRLQARVERAEQRGFPGTGADLLLLATGFLKNEPRMLQEYLRMHGEAVPEAVRAHMTTPLARLLDEASKRNLQQEWVVLRPRLAGDWRRFETGTVPCALYANGKAMGPLRGARLRVMPDVPQRLHIRCGEELHIASTVVPALVSSEVETLLSPSNAARFGRGESEPPLDEPLPLSAEAPQTPPHGKAGDWSTRTRLGLTAHLMRVWGRAEETALHNFGLVDGLFLRGGVRYATDAWFLGLSATRARQEKPPTSDTEGRASAAERTIQAFALEGGLVWSVAESISVPFTLGVWRWRCDVRPCGFHKKDPGLTLSAGPAVELPLGPGIGVELALAPGVVVGANPVPFLDFGVQVRREW